MPTKRQLTKARELVRTLTAKMDEKKKLVAQLRRCIRAWQREKDEGRKKASERRRNDSRLRRKEARRHRRWHAYLDARQLNLNLPPELHQPVPTYPGVRQYPRADLELVSEWVCAWMLGHLQRAAEQLRGVAFVYRYPESLEVDGRLMFRVPGDADRSEVAGDIADVLEPMRADVDMDVITGDTVEVARTLYWHEVWVQSCLVFYEMHMGRDGGKERGSPGDRSRLLPGGIREVELHSHWRRGDLAVPLETLFQIEQDFRERAEERQEEFDMGLYELRFHWTPTEARPDREREGADRTNCEGSRS
jgi:hypothetical protein